jgi:hypothetical protein
MKSINERLYALYAGKWGNIGEALQESVDGDPISHSCFTLATKGTGLAPTCG